VGALLDRLLARRHLKAPLRIYRVRAAWPELVGSLMAGHSCPTSLQHECLNVAVSDSVWLQEMSYLKGAVLVRTQELLGEECRVEELRFRVKTGASCLPGEWRRRKRADEDPEQELRRRPLAPAVAEELSAFEEHLDGVPNPDLRRSIRRAYIRHLLKEQ